MNQAPALLNGGGEMGALMRARDWANTPLGPVETWPQPLVTLLRVALGSAQPMLVCWGPDHLMLYNDAMMSIMGIKHPDALGRGYLDVWDEIRADLAPLVQQVSNGIPVNLEKLAVKFQRMGYEEEATFSISYTPVFGLNGTVEGFFVATQETTGQVHAQQRLRELNETLEQQVAERTAERNQIWQVSRDMLGIADDRGVWLSVNPAWTHVLGWAENEIVGRTSEWMEHPDDQAKTRAEVGRLAVGATTFEFENRFRTKDGDFRILSWTAVPENGLLYCVARDITVERAQAEALRQSQKMEAVGQLTGGLAHDFNNLLAGISGSLELMGTRIAQGRLPDVERYLVAAQGAARRAAALTHRLLAFSRRQTLEPKPTAINALIMGMEDLIRRTVGPSVTLESVAAGGVWNVLIDPPQLENALLNLCINARDAMPDGGKLVIETANRWLDERGARERDLAPGQYVSLCVSDNGTGMAPDVIARAFDPFFTTKPIGVGTGLGLSMIYGFAKQSGGQARIYSEIGGGTMVCLYLPRHHADEVAEPVAPIAEAGRALMGQTVLVIDDEPLVRMLVVDVLEEQGYTALEAGDGPEGMKIIRSGARIDLLVTDVGLPNGMNGRQVADAARELRPGLKVLFVTGYAENAVLSHGHLDPGMQVITKPFEVEALAARVRSMIEARQEKAPRRDPTL